MNGIVYCRVSSKEQTEGTSLESQRLACEEYARSKNIKVLRIFVEQGESAKFADRTQLLELLDFCRKNKNNVQVLLVWKIDRFARNVADHFNIKAALLKYGVRIVSVTEPIDSKPEGKLMETILAGFAEFDNEIRAMRSVQGMRRKIQEGIFPWIPPLGYKSANLRGAKKIEPDVPDQPLFGLLRRAWKEFATGAYTKAEIRRLMTNWGILTRQGEPISPQSLDAFFRNEYYAGVITDPWSHEEFDGRHIPMVSREEFAQVQQTIQKRARSEPHQKERPEFPLRGLVRCHKCRRYMTGSFSRGRSRRYPYYHCSNKDCDQRGKGHPTNGVHREFQTFLEQVGPEPGSMEKVTELVLQLASEENASRRSKKTRLRTELRRLKSQVQELIRMRTAKQITDEEFLPHKIALWEKQMALESQVREDKTDVQQVRSWLDELREKMVQLPRVWGSMSLSHRRRFERYVLPAGFVEGKIRTAELGLVFKLFDDFSEGNTNGVGPVGVEPTASSMSMTRSTDEL